uniref:Sugar phosphate transporter domain-containing protein n=1 Tax=Ditylum brightwellii TaxID=49249 RepID=A0A7S2A2C0_9STRA|mmetsp:Transcript_7184/g.10813  ORF Transcript_7184/g.10813 Transcript_7184/m.10813 type:complete len:463 (+) Transcript_7184:170-1558(+)
MSENSTSSNDDRLAPLQRFKSTRSRRNLNEVLTVCNEEEFNAAHGGHWRRRSSSMLVIDDWATSPASLSDFNPASQEERLTSMVRRASSRRLLDNQHLHADKSTLLQRRPLMQEVKEKKIEKEELKTDKDETSKNNWILYAVGVLVMGVGASLPYNAIHSSDPGCSLFIAFVTHIFLVACNLHKVVPSMLKSGGKTTLPFSYHAALVFLSFTFNVLRADASSRLPPAVVMMIMNGRMLIGMVYDFLFWGVRYSFDQVLSAAVITLGIVWSGISTSIASSRSNSEDKENDILSMAIGAAELVLGLVLITILTTTIKIGFQRYGECPEEQILFQHLLALPMFYLIESQWQQIGPRLDDWMEARDWIKGALLLSILVFTMVHMHSMALFTARAPNLLLYQIVDTVKKFTIVVVTALYRAPPLPPAGFWGGSILLVVGTLRFLSVSQPPKEEDGDDIEEEESKKKK